MKTVRCALILLPLLLAAGTTAFAQTQLESNEKACASYKKADAALNKTYQQILSQYRADTLFIEKLRTAQRAWIAYRDAHLEALYPAADKRAEYGTVNPMCQCTALEEITNERTKMLKKWIDGIEEGDVCGGSIKTKE
jgi:uncharacterized protein YecT (DUF1311 family)